MLKFKINCLNVYVCKYMPEEVFRRRWVVEYKESKVNKKIGSAYFMVGLENISFDFNSKEKTSNMYVDSAIIYNVKLSKDQTK